MEMQQLRHVCTVAAHGQIGAAARELDMTQPALSRSIRNLERSLGVQLFDRSRTGVVPTPYGQLFLRHAQSLMNEVQRTLENLEAMRGVTTGKVRFGFTGSFERDIVPQALQSYLREHPGVDLVALSGFYEDLSAQVLAGELDLAFVQLPEVRSFVGLTEEVLLPMPFHVFAAKAHPLARRTKIALSDLAAHGWVVPDHAAIRALDRYFERDGLAPPRSVVRTNSMSMMFNGVTSWGLLSLLPDYLFEQERARGEVVRLDVHALPEVKHAGLIYREGAVTAPAAVALMNHLRRECRARAAAGGAPSPATPPIKTPRTTA